MRCSLRHLMMMLLMCTFVFLLFKWNRCTINKRDDNFFRESSELNSFPKDSRYSNRVAQSLPDDLAASRPIHYEEIQCIINNEFTIKGRREDQEVFIPFTFIQKYFEVYGKLVHIDGFDRFEWQHSYSEVYPPKQKYSPSGVFMYFQRYNVEVRDRVKCISASEGVPISTQWGPQGYHYPIQIAQFGLSHYSKFLAEEEPDVIILEDGEEGDITDWKIPTSRSRAKVFKDPEVGKVVEFSTGKSLDTPGITLEIEEDKVFILSLDFKFLNNGSFTVSLKDKKKQTFHIHYVFSYTLIAVAGQDIFYGLGDDIPQSWRHITRNIAIDFQKGMGLKYSNVKKVKLRNIIAKISAISLRGQGMIDNLTVSSSAHLDQFYDAANWLVNHQDDKGGWPTMVTRRLIPDILELSPGWYSAMGQGQAMSLLVRAYFKSKNTMYLNAAEKALHIFEINSAEGGVVTKYAETYKWYEEYPTQPSSFVLNGFIYSLIGLYDVKEVASGSNREQAEKLFREGMHSLRNMLLLFDNGSGTFYDLRHLTLGIAPNRARWDYHTTHINQILLLSTIDRDSLFKTTADRWISYMKGKRAPHN